MRLASVAVIFFLFAGNPEVNAQSVEPFYYYVPAVSRNFAPSIQFVEDSSSSKLTVCIYNPWQQKVRVSLSKNGFRTWHRVPLRRYWLVFNFKKADAGKYLVTVYAGDEKHTKTVTIEESGRDDNNGKE